MADIKVKIGVIGCGNISSIYFKNCNSFKILDVVACADLDIERAKIRAKEFNIPKACSVKELLSDPEIKIIVNLTIPKAHAEVAFKAIDAGKSVYNEKPLAITREDGKEILKKAKEKKVIVGCAPETFMGGGIQTCRKAIDEGLIGKPLACTAFMTCHGHESWHPDPEFYYKIGGGPMFDMGPYYLTALVSLIGPMKRITGSARISFPERTITSKPKNGTKIIVDTPTHIAGVMDFADGCVGTIITSFDVWFADLPRIEIYGSEGSLSVPDPNTFGGPVKLRKPGDTEWKDIAIEHKYTENSRGIGVADMAYSLLYKRAHRANGEMAYHVLDIMHAFHDASKTRKHIELKSSCERPKPLPLNVSKFELDQ